MFQVKFLPVDFKLMRYIGLVIPNFQQGLILCEMPVLWKVVPLLQPCSLVFSSTNSCCHFVLHHLDVIVHQLYTDTDSKNSSTFGNHLTAIFIIICLGRLELCMLLLHKLPWTLFIIIMTQNKL